MRYGVMKDWHQKEGSWLDKDKFIELVAESAEEEVDKLVEEEVGRIENRLEKVIPGELMEDFWDYSRKIQDISYKKGLRDGLDIKL